MRYPKKVAIGPYEYAIVANSEEIHRANRGDNTLYAGQIRYMEGRILLQTDQPANRVRETILHEVLHGIFDVTALDDMMKGNGEPFIRRFSPLLLDTLRRNPELVAYLTSEEVPGGDQEAEVHGGAGRARGPEGGHPGRLGAGPESGPIAWATGGQVLSREEAEAEVRNGR